MSDLTRHLVIGLGETGRPLLRVLRVFGNGIEAHGRDLDPLPMECQFHVVHICFPYSRLFAAYVVRYIKRYKPDLCIVHSTVVPGTTTRIADFTDCLVAYSPIRGRHGHMERDLIRYRKFVASPDEMGLPIAENTLRACGFEVQVMEPPAALELAKLLETTYSGLLIAWAQEMERFAQTVEADYWDVMPFLAEPAHLPGVAFVPGHIGGHCIMPNLELLEQVKGSGFLELIRLSNADTPEGDGKRLWPVPMDQLLAERGCSCPSRECC